MVWTGGETWGQDGEEPIPERIEAQELIVEDWQGNVFAFFGVPAGDSSGALLELIDDRQQRRLMIGQLDVPESLTVMALLCGKQCITLGASSDPKKGAILAQTDVEGRDRVVLCTRAQTVFPDMVKNGWGDEEFRPIVTVVGDDEKAQCIVVSSPRGAMASVLKTGGGEVAIRKGTGLRAIPASGGFPQPPGLSGGTSPSAYPGYSAFTYGSAQSGRQAGRNK